jgi:SseB protein N-terminal domain
VTNRPPTQPGPRSLPGAVDPADAGAADPVLAGALGQAYARRGPAHDGGADEAVAAALAAARVFVGVEPRLLSADGATGAEKESEMALVTLRAASGATAVPAFTSVGALTAWRGGARPVPVDGAGLCAEAVRLGHVAVVLDPGSDRAVTVDGDALADLAAGRVPMPGGASARVMTTDAPRLRPATSRLPRRARRALVAGLWPHSAALTVWRAEADIGASATADGFGPTGRWRPALVVALAPAGPSVGVVTGLVRAALTAAGRPAADHPDLVVVGSERSASLRALLGDPLLGAPESGRRRSGRRPGSGITVK